MKKVEQKIIEFKCYKCAGTGHNNYPLTDLQKDVVDQRPEFKDKCTVCDGTGIYKETFYYFFDGKKKMAWSGDTLK